jgi:hypothetical protein
MTWCRQILTDRRNQNLVQDLPLVRYRVRQNVIKRRQPVGGDDQEVLAQVVDIPDLAAADQRHPFQFGLINGLLSAHETFASFLPALNADRG